VQTILACQHKMTSVSLADVEF